VTASFYTSLNLLPDLNGLSKALFDLFDSYDQKDWERLRRNTTPTVRVEYSGIGFQNWPEMPLDDYITMCSNSKFLGDPCTMTQHLVGASYFERVSETEAIGYHQLRAAHQVYTAPDLKEVKFLGHAQATNLHWYKNVDGVWKFAGLKPKVLWGEGGWSKVWDRGEGGSFWE